MGFEPFVDFLHGVKVRRLRERVDGVEFVMAEVDEGRRQHRRILAVSSQDETLDGRPIVYSDTYADRDGSTYIYAAHRWDVPGFLGDLDSFLMKKFAEWSGRPFPVVVNRRGELARLHLQMPFHASVSEQDSILFIKFTFPFGPIAIEFRQLNVGESELGALKNRHLPRALQAPLIGCDVTRTELPAMLVTCGHWTSGRIGPEVMASLTLQAAPQPV